MKNQMKNPLFILDSINDWVNGMDNYEERKVLRYESDDLIVDTCYASDTGMYETAVSDKRYREDGAWMVIEEYESKEESSKGHNKWVKKLTSSKPPKTLPNVQFGENFTLKPALVSKHRSP